MENPGWWNIVICPGISGNLTAAENWQNLHQVVAALQVIWTSHGTKLRATKVEHQKDPEINPFLGSFRHLLRYMFVTDTFNTVSSTTPLLRWKGTWNIQWQDAYYCHPKWMHFIFHGVCPEAARCDIAWYDYHPRPPLSSPFFSVQSGPTPPGRFSEAAAPRTPRP